MFRFGDITPTALDRPKGKAGVQRLAFSVMERCHGLPANIANAPPFPIERPVSEEGRLDAQGVPAPAVPGRIDMFEARVHEG